MCAKLHVHPTTFLIMQNTPEKAKTRTNDTKIRKIRVDGHNDYLEIRNGVHTFSSLGSRLIFAVRLAGRQADTKSSSLH